MELITSFTKIKAYNILFGTFQPNKTATYSKDYIGWHTNSWHICNVDMCHCVTTNISVRFQEVVR